MRESCKELQQSRACGAEHLFKSKINIRQSSIVNQLIAPEEPMQS
jgi:hypothetical protein